ncbi:hypothetical protein NBRC116494_28910 [Aurantivibrio plasticivorans]
MMKYYVIFAIYLLSISTWANSNSDFGIEMVALNNGETRHIKFNRVTGEAWWSKNTVWQRIEDPNSIPKSAYEFRVVSTGLNWRTIRLDTITGEAWKNSEGTWVKFTNR